MRSVTLAAKLRRSGRNLIAYPRPLRGAATTTGLCAVLVRAGNDMITNLNPESPNYQKFIIRDLG